MEEDQEGQEDFLLEEDLHELIETLLLIMTEYITDNPTAIAEPDFHETFIENITSLFKAQLEDDLEEEKGYSKKI